MSKNESKKSMLKKVFVFCLTGVMFFSLAACGCKKSTTSSSKNEKSIAQEKEKKIDNIGKFKTTDLEKNKVTQDIFKENNLTMVNLFSSTCNPCIEEIPHLAELSNEYKNKKVGIIGINIDTDSSGNPDENSREMVLKVLNNKKSNMKVIFWDENLKNTLLKKTDALPYTFFIDKNGTIVGEDYLGDRSKKDWAKIIDKELDNISKK